MKKLILLVSSINQLIQNKILITNTYLNIKLFSRIGEEKANKITFQLLLNYNKLFTNWELRKVIELFNRYLIEGVPSSDLYMTIIFEYYKLSDERLL